MEVTQAEAVTSILVHSLGEVDIIPGSLKQGGLKWVSGESRPIWVYRRASDGESREIKDEAFLGVGPVVAAEERAVAPLDLARSAGGQGLTEARDGPLPFVQSGSLRPPVTRR